MRDKLLLEAMKKQLGDAEWALLSEQERQARLTKMKLLEKRLRREGKYDEAAKLLGDAMKDADFLQVIKVSQMKLIVKYTYTHDLVMSPS